MLTRRILLSLAALALGIVFAAGVVQLFILRFEAGDIYPPYSSLRSDPLGTRAFFDALDTSPELAVTRHLDPASRLRNRSGETLFILGLAPTTRTTPDEIEDLLRYAAAGNRLVLTLLPVSEEPSRPKPTPTPPAKSSPTPKEEDEEPLTRAALDLLGERTGFQFEYHAKKKDLTATATNPTALESPLSWHSVVVFDSLGDTWRVLYETAGRPVVIERPYGAGSLVLATDSYLFSNQALREERHPRLLAWFLGPHHAIVFDETHHGIAASPGIMTLVHRYRLQPLLGVCLLLGLLFVWHNALPFNPAPPRTETTEPNVVSGRDAARARIDLLRRSVPPSELPAVCADRWRQSFAHRAGPSAAAALAAVDEATAEAQAAPARKRNPVETYRRIARSLPRFQ